MKDELHALVDRLPESDAREALDYLRTRIERASQPGQAFIDDCQRALNEAMTPGAARIPHNAVHPWLQTWGTAEEDAADTALQALEERARRGMQGAGGE